MARRRSAKPFMPVRFRYLLLNADWLSGEAVDCKFTSGRFDSGIRVEACKKLLFSGCSVGRGRLALIQDLATQVRFLPRELEVSTQVVYE